MRVFIFSIVIMIIIISGIICNTLYMDNLTNKMLEIIKELPENDDSTKLDELIQLWDSNIKFVSINIGTIYIIDINAAIIDVEAYFQSDFDSHYKSACNHLYQAVLRLHELERFSIDNII